MTRIGAFQIVLVAALFASVFGRHISYSGIKDHVSLQNAADSHEISEKQDVPKKRHHHGDEGEHRLSDMDDPQGDGNDEEEHIDVDPPRPDDGDKIHESAIMKAIISSSKQEEEDAVADAAAADDDDNDEVTPHLGEDPMPDSHTNSSHPDESMDQSDTDHGLNNETEEITHVQHRHHHRGRFHHDRLRHWHHHHHRQRNGTRSHHHGSNMTRNSTGEFRPRPSIGRHNDTADVDDSHGNHTKHVVENGESESMPIEEGAGKGHSGKNNTNKSHEYETQHPNKMEEDGQKHNQHPHPSLPHYTHPEQQHETETDEVGNLEVEGHDQNEADGGDEEAEHEAEQEPGPEPEPEPEVDPENDFEDEFEVDVEVMEIPEAIAP